MVGILRGIVPLELHREFCPFLKAPLRERSVFLCLHYQKIDKYKRKYRQNIFVGKFSRDFTDGNIPSVYTDGITVGKKFKTKQKKKDDVSFLPTELPTEFSVGKLPR
jgi:hypothetical protein